MNINTKKGIVSRREILETMAPKEKHFETGEPVYTTEITELLTEKEYEQSNKRNYVILKHERIGNKGYYKVGTLCPQINVKEILQKGLGQIPSPLERESIRKYLYDQQI